MDPKPATYLRITDVITGALIMGTWATYNLSTQVDSRETKTLINKVLLPILGISIISCTGILLQTPFNLLSYFIPKNNLPPLRKNKEISQPKPPYNEEDDDKEEHNKLTTPITKPSIPPQSIHHSISLKKSDKSGGGVVDKISIPKLSRRNSSVSSIINDDRDTEILVHNVSHSDVILALSNMVDDETKLKTKKKKNMANENENDDDEATPPILARPHFFSFNPVIKNVLSWMADHKVESAKADTLERNSLDPKHSFIGGGGSVNIGLKLSPPCPLRRITTSSSIQSKLSFRKDDYNILKNKVKTNNLLSHGISGGDSSDSDVDDNRSVQDSNKKNKVYNNNNDFDNIGDDDGGDNEGYGVERERLRKLDRYVLNQSSVTHVHFPLIATMMPVWISKLRDKHPSFALSPRSPVSMSDYEDETPSIRKIIILVSGEGVPRSESGISDQNSTESTAYMMEEWIKFHYPYVEVIKKHSKTNLFRYDENIAFVKKKLLPSLESLRDYKAKTRGEKWPDAFKLTVSFASGSPARITAIQSSLRNYRPEFLHIWQRKTFWEKSMVCLDDIEFLSSNDLDTLSAEPVKSLEGNLEKVVNQLIKLKDKYRQTLLSQNHDMDSFWHRKSKKVVLSVLLVEKEEPDENGNKIIKLYDGTNMEVSMPTGSLCAERNAIGSALSDDLSLKRTELKIIAVLGFNLKKNLISSASTSSSTTPSVSRNAMPMPPMLELGGQNLSPKQTSLSSNVISMNITPRSRHGSNAEEVDHEAMKGLEEMDEEAEGEGEAEERDNIRKGNTPTLLAMASNQLLSPPSTSSSSSLPAGWVDDEHDKGGDVTTHNLRSLQPQPPLPSTVLSPPAMPSPSRTHIVRDFIHPEDEDEEDDHHEGSGGGIMSKSETDLTSPTGSSSVHGFLKRSYGSTSPKSATSSVTTPAQTAFHVKVCENDMNPLKPCGSCSEWLKKIAEVNPSFKVLSFTDENCSGGVYVESIFDT